MAKKQNKKNRLVSILAIVLVLAFGATYILSTFMGMGEAKSVANKKTKVEIPFTKHGDLRIISANDTIAFEMEVADTEYLTARGLMYRSKLEENHGMLFIFPNVQPRSFYMKNTRIGLDIIYANENKEIVSFAKNAKPYDISSLPSNAPAKYVFEINAGMVDKLGIKKGDKLSWVLNK